MCALETLLFPACDLSQNFLYFLLFLEEVGFAFQLNIISTIASDQFNIIGVNAAVYLIAVSTGHSVRSIHEVWTFYVLEYWEKKDNLKKILIVIISITKGSARRKSFGNPRTSPMNFVKLSVWYRRSRGPW